MSNTAQDTGMRKSDRLIPWYIVAFFVVVAILDGIFVYIATSTHTGVVSEQAYDKGLAYNETVAAAEKQAALGWQHSISHEDGRLIFTLTDGDGAALKDAAVKAVIRRPIGDTADFTLELRQIVDGRYEAPISFPANGQWDARIYALWQDKDYQAHKRLIVTAP
ncbi:FixH family protein [Kordiimonas sp.]|uniref:FixH family protein n=1 Tax=Kordiimonas sp. TaxID=1970157 RepID=UPI003A8EF144